MADVGRVGFVPPDLSGAIFNYHILRLRLDERVVSPRYFYYFVRGAEAVGEYLADVNRGATRDGINTNLFSRMPLHLPPVPEQRRIVARLDQLSARSRAARDHLARIAKLAVRAKQAILAAMTVDPWGDGNSEEVSVAEVATATFDGPFGSNLKTEDYTVKGVQVVRLENIGHLTFRSDRKTYISEEKYETLRRHTLNAGDLVFSIVHR